MRRIVIASLAAFGAFAAAPAHACFVPHTNPPVYAFWLELPALEPGEVALEVEDIADAPWSMPRAPSPSPDLVITTCGGEGNYRFRVLNVVAGTYSGDIVQIVSSGPLVPVDGSMSVSFDGKPKRHLIVGRIGPWHGKYVTDKGPYPPPATPPGVAPGEDVFFPRPRDYKPS